MLRASAVLVTGMIRALITPASKWFYMPKPGRNDPCTCGSGKKYKKCCLGKELSEMKQTTAFQPSQESIKSPQRRQRIIAEHQPILEKMERMVSESYQHDPSLTGQDIIGVYKTLFSVLTRRADEEQARTALASLSPGTKPIHDALEKAILTFDQASYSDPESGTHGHGEGVADDKAEETHSILSIKGVSAMRDCLSLLIDSARFWTRKAGPKGYLEYISEFFA